MGGQSIRPRRGGGEAMTETCDERFLRLASEAIAAYKRGEAVTWPPLPQHDLYFGGSWYRGCSDYEDRAVAAKGER